MNTHRKGQNQTKATPLPSRFSPIFIEYRDELDGLNVVLEAVYKLARDITAASKKVIGFLQRISPKNPTLYAAHLATARNDLHTVNASIYDLMLLLSPEFVKARDAYINDSQTMVEFEPMSLFWRCYPKFGFALEEYVEACSFLYYLSHGSLISQQWLEDVLTEDFRITHRSRMSKALAKNDMCVDDKADTLATENPSSRLTTRHGKMHLEADTAAGCAVECGCERLEKALEALPAPVLRVPFKEYYLGIFDLGGEVMRFATSNASATPPWLLQEGREIGPEEDVCATCATFLADLYGCMQKLLLSHSRTLKIRGRDSSKVDAMAHSVQKLERLSYQWTTRRSEYGPDVIEKMMTIMSNERPNEEECAL